MKGIMIEIAKVSITATKTEKINKNNKNILSFLERIEFNFLVKLIFIIIDVSFL
jgi:hypothetical protein